MLTEHLLFLVLGIAPKPRAKVLHAVEDVRKPPGSLLATDRSKAVVLV